MELQINENMRLRSDTYNIILEERSIIKKSKNEENIGNEQWTASGYYPSAEMALQDYINKTIRSSDTKGIFELVDLIKSVKAEIVELKLDFKKEGYKEEEDKNY